MRNQFVFLRKLWPTNCRMGGGVNLGLSYTAPSNREIPTALTRRADWEAKRRWRLRQRYSKRVLGHIEQLLVTHRDTVVPVSLLGKALYYLNGQWPKLIRYVDNGQWPISNNPCENAIRPFVVGRRGWLFSDTVDGAHASANLYSLVEICKAHRIDPYRYFAWLFQNLTTGQ